MSVDKWAYEPSKCDGSYCCGECDNCHNMAMINETRVFVFSTCGAKWGRTLDKMAKALGETVLKLNELQEVQSIKKERSLFE